MHGWSPLNMNRIDITPEETKTAPYPTPVRSRFFTADPIRGSIFKVDDGIEYDY